MATRKKRAKDKRSASTKKRSASSFRQVGALRARAAGIKKRGERFYDRQGKRISAESARQRVERREAREAKKLAAEEKRLARERSLEKRRARDKARKEKKQLKFYGPRQKKKPVSPKKRVYRDADGRFISYDEVKRLKIEKRIAKAHGEERKAEGLKRRKQFAVPVQLHNKLCREIAKVADKARKSNADLGVEVSCASAGAAFDAIVEIFGFPRVLLLDDLTEEMEESFEKAQKIILDALLSVQKSLPKRRGMLVAVTLQPIESLVLQYGRDVPLMTTRWMRADHPEEIKNLVMRSKKLLRSLWAHKWQIERALVKFRYDNEVGKRGFRTEDEGMEEWLG